MKAGATSGKELDGVIFSGGGKGRLPEPQDAAEKERRPAAKEDKPCSQCGHLCSAHAPAHYTRMYCNTEGCSCNGYFPSKSYEAVVRENLALHKEIEQLKKALAAMAKG